jgi:hypothetical protein
MLNGVSTNGTSPCSFSSGDSWWRRDVGYRGSASRSYNGFAAQSPTLRPASVVRHHGLKILATVIIGHGTGRRFTLEDV